MRSKRRVHPWQRPLLWVALSIPVAWFTTIFHLQTLPARDRRYDTLFHRDGRWSNGTVTLWEHDGRRYLVRTRTRGGELECWTQPVSHDFSAAVLSRDIEAGYRETDRIPLWAAHVVSGLDRGDSHDGIIEFSLRGWPVPYEAMGFAGSSPLSQTKVIALLLPGHLLLSLPALPVGLVVSGLMLEIIGRIRLGVYRARVGRERIRRNPDRRSHATGDDAPRTSCG